MKAKFFGLAVAGIALAAGSAQVAHSQAWIGEMVGNMMAQQQAAAERHACYMGGTMEASEITEALGPTNDLMQRYFAAMQAGSAQRSSFYALDKRARWRFGGEELGQAQLDTPAEPFAASGMVIDAQPHAYVRSGMNAFTLADWQVRDADGVLVGTYTGYFVRQLGEWKIRELTLTPASEYVEPVRQFCFVPGDVMPYRLDYTARTRVIAERQLTKGEAKLARLDKKLASAEAKAKAKPNSDSAQAALATARSKTDKWTEIVASRRDELKAAQKAEQSAQEEAARQKAEREAGEAGPAAG